MDVIDLNNPLYNDAIGTPPKCPNEREKGHTVIMTLEVEYYYDKESNSYTMFCHKIWTKKFYCETCGHKEVK